MVLGISIFHLLVLIVLLAGIALPSLYVENARHARALLTTILLLTVVCFVLFLWFAHAPGRSDLVLFRCYAFSSSLCSLVDELHSARDEEKPVRFRFLSLLGLLFLLTLLCVIGGIYGAF
jgi:hypothetical protein